MMEVLSLVARSMAAEHGACQVHCNLGEYQNARHLHWQVLKDDRNVGLPSHGQRPQAQMGHRERRALACVLEKLLATLEGGVRGAASPP